MRARTAVLALTAASALSAFPALGQAASGTTIKLKANPVQLKFSTSRIVLAKPGKVTLVMTNPSPLMHNIAIKGGGLKRPVLGKIVGKGKSSTVSVTLKKGSYQFFCSVDGHAKAGMKGVLIVK